MHSRMGLIFTATLFLTGCAATPYQPSGLRGGYSEVRMGPDEFTVTFNGNGYSTESQTRAMATLRGAELCREAGFAWIATVKDNSKIERTVSTRPASTRISTYANTNSRGRYTGSTGYVTTTPEQTSVTERPVAKLQFRCLRTNPKRDRAILHAEQYIRSVGPQFGVPPSK
ncbi:hypothetical protein K2X89_07545 [Myxococcota bacterium]|nr:hypothetical protein [Myxococcota bacterium]